MPGGRIKGQEIELALVKDGQLQTTVTAISSFEFAYQLEILSEGYIGETTERKDSIFKGIHGQMEMHVESAAIFNLWNSIVDKARRRVPGARITIKGAFNFPDGTRARLVISDAEFGEIPFNFGSREEYGTSTLEFEASEARAIIT